MRNLNIYVSIGIYSESDGSFTCLPFHSNLFIFDFELSYSSYIEWEGYNMLYPISSEAWKKRNYMYATKNNKTDLENSVNQ